MEEPVVLQAEVDERGLDRGLDVDDLADVDVTDVAGGVEAFGVELFELPVLDDGDAALVVRDVVDDHLGFGHGRTPRESGGEARADREA